MVISTTKGKPHKGGGIFHHTGFGNEKFGTGTPLGREPPHCLITAEVEMQNVPFYYFGFGHLHKRLSLSFL